MPDKQLQIEGFNDYKNGDKVLIRAKDNNDGTYSLSVSVSELLNKDIGTDAGGRARVSTITTLFDGKTLNQDDPLIWENVGTGTTTFIDNSTTLSVTAGKYMIRRGRHSIPYFSGKSQQIETTFDGFSSSIGVVKRCGYFSSNAVAPYDSQKDGFWLESDSLNNISLKIEKVGVVKASIPITQFDNYAAIADYDFDLFTVLEWDYLWLGGTKVRLFIKIDGEFVLIHTYKHAGRQSGTFIKTPNHSVRYEIRSTTGSDSFNAICSYVGTEGAIPDDGKPIALLNLAAIATNNAGIIYALKGVKKTSANRDVGVAIQSVAVSNTTTADSGMILVILNPTLSAPLTYANKSRISEGTATNQTVTPNTGRIIAAIPSGTTGQAGGLNNTILAQIGMSIQDVSDEIVLAYLATSASQSVHGALTIREY